MVDSSDFSIESAVDKATEKVRFREDIVDGDKAGLDTNRGSFKDTLIGKEGGENKDSSTLKNDDDFELLDEDIITGKEDENNYFLVKFRPIEDYTKALTKGLWVIFGQYLTIQPWTQNFSTIQPYPHNVVAWIRLPGLPRYMYEKKLVKVIGERIGPVVRLNDNIDNSFRVQLDKITVFLDLNKPLISRIKIEDRVQWIEYESFPNNVSVPTPSCPNLDYQATQEKYGPWMLSMNQHSSRFNLLHDLQDDEAEILENHIPNPTNHGSGQRNGIVNYGSPLVEKKSLPKQIEENLK
ncbi:hypothetical protein Gotur_017254, partial [Gossypium turneri]